MDSLLVVICSHLNVVGGLVDGVHSVVSQFCFLLLVVRDFAHSVHRGLFAESVLVKSSTLLGSQRGGVVGHFRS